MDAIEEAKRRLLRLFPEGSDGVFGPLINAIIEKAVCDSSMSREAEAVRRHEEAAMAGGPDRFVRATFATEWFTTLGWLPPEAAQQKDAEVERLVATMRNAAQKLLRGCVDRLDRDPDPTRRL